jgi:hypothetical protein
MREPLHGADSQIRLFVLGEICHDSLVVDVPSPPLDRMQMGHTKLR